MKMILKSLTASLALVVLTAGVYKSNNATINFPDGWSSPEADADGIIVTRQSENGANCNLEVRKLPALADQTMAQINADYGHVFDVDDWADFLGTSPDKLTVIASDIRPLEDAIFHIATLKVPANATVNAVFRYGFYVLPGRVVMAGCYAEESLYPIYTTLFEKTISSLRPW